MDVPGKGRKTEAKEDKWESNMLMKRKVMM